jgi:transcriptional regulator with XRE-family HTH domain
MNIGSIITDLRKNKGWSQNQLAQAINVSREIVGRYERNDAVPSIEVAKRIADAFEVSLDHLVGEGLNADFDKKAMERLKDLELLEEDKKRTLFDLIDTYIRDAKTRKTYLTS